MSWYEERFSPAPNRIATACSQCGKGMWLPPSKVEMYQTCGPACRKVRGERVRAARSRSCETCGAVFSPRQVQIDRGQGRFCSQVCNTAGRIAMTTPESLRKGQETRKRREASGELVRPKGEANKQWRGGPKASRERQIADGRSAAYRRAYRAKNPHKVREFAIRRKNAKGHGTKLPPGTVQRIGDLQKWKCAICRVSIRKSYHMDHIMPFKRGGTHEPRNIQLLCPTCNVRKNSKDPVTYMQELGRLI